MANNTGWERKKLTGAIGEAVALSVLFMPVWCWPTEKGFCHRWQDVEYKAQEGKKVDADVIITFNACEASADGERQRCPMLEGDTGEPYKQLHEIKTNVATFDRAIGGSSDHTQNLYIELIQSPYYYPQNKIEWEKDPLEDGKEIPYRGGIGWWKKREYAYENGYTKYDKAHWYHFYQPLDMWECLKAAKTQDENGNWKLLYPDLERPTGAEAQYLKATDEEIQEWIDDWIIDDNAILITQIPVEICISVPCDVLKGMVSEIEEEFEEWGVPKKTTDKCYIKNDLLCGYKIAVKDIIPCVNMGTIKRDEPYETTGKPGVIVSLVGEYVRLRKQYREKNEKGEKEKWVRIKGIIPDPSTVGGDMYVPARLIGEAGEDGVSRRNIRPFSNAYVYEKTGARWVPRAIWEFENTKLKHYPYEW